MSASSQTAPDSHVARAAPVARLAMGLVFVVAGAAKSWDPLLFYWEVVSYLDLLGTDRHVWHRLASTAIMLAPLEAGVGLALIANWKPRLVHSIAVVLMGLFLALTVYAWISNANVDCGCFGALAERTPGQAAIEDTFMLAMLLVSWRWGTTRWPTGGWLRAHQLVMAGTLAAVVVVAMRFYPETHRLADSDLAPGIELRGLELKGVDIDLSEGTYLVEFFSPKCPRCKKAVPKLNRWAASGELPPLVALNIYAQDSPELGDFRTQMKPRFEIATISTSDWMRLTAGHGWPRLAAVTDGVVQHVWEHDRIPTTQQLVRALNTSVRTAPTGS